MADKDEGSENDAEKIIDKDDNSTDNDKSQ